MMHVANARLKDETGATAERSRSCDERAVVWSRVTREHAMIRTLFDAVERCGVAAVTHQRGGLDSFRRAVWDLFIAFDDHLAMEEREVLPILRAHDASGEARARSIIAEHHEQRRVILELVEDTECDMKEVDVLVAQATALLQAFRTDMELEEHQLAAALPGTGGVVSPEGR